MSRSTLEDNLHRHLVSVESLQISAMDANPEAIGALVKGLAEAQTMTKRGISQGSLTSKTLAFARSIASVGKAIANHLLGVERINSDVGERRRVEMETAMEYLSLEDLSSSATASSSTDTLSPEVQSKTKPESHAELPVPASSTNDIILLSETTSSETLASEMDTKKRPTHVSQSCEWLVAHLHNPYPPVSVKKRIASEAGVQVKSVEDWFTYMRKRIGWTSVVQKHFRNSRPEAIDCAVSVLNGEPTRQPFKPEQCEALLAMKATALSLFEEFSGGDEAVKTVEAVIKLSKSVVYEERRQEVGATPEISLPSEKNSVDGADASATHKTPLTRRRGKKRCYGADVGDTEGQTDSLTRPSKRKRSSTTSSGLLASLPPVASPTVSSGCCPPRSRKRKRSDAREDEDSYGDDAHVKKPRGTDLTNPVTGTNSGGLSYHSGPCGTMTAEIGAANIYEPGSFGTTSEDPSDSIASSPSGSLLTVSDDPIESLFASPSEVSQLSEALNTKDLVDLPNIPTFIWDGTDIYPPSFEPIPLSTDFSISHFEANDDYVPGLDDSDLSWLSSLEPNLHPESKLEAPTNWTGAVEQLESDTTLFSALLQDFFCNDNTLALEQVVAVAGQS